MSTETSAGQTTPNLDRAVRAIFDFIDGPDHEGYTDADIKEADQAVAIIIRVLRDDLVLAWQSGEIGHLIDVERILTDRAATLQGEPSTTGDTTVPGFAGYR